MTEWKSTTRRDRSIPPARQDRPESLPTFGAGSLSRGVVQVVVRPVLTEQQAEDVALVLWRIRGVGGIELSELTREDAEFAVRLTRPAALGSDLRAAFGRELVGCTKVADRFVVEIHPQAPSVPSPVAAPLRSPLDGPRGPGPAGELPAAAGDMRATTPVRPFAPAPGGDPSPGPAAAPPAWPAEDRAPSAPTPAHTGPDQAAASATPAPGRALVPAPPVPVPELPSRDPVELLGALAADPLLSIIATGPDRVVRAAFGSLHHHFGRAPGPVVGRLLSEIVPFRGQQALADRAAAAVRGSRSTLVVDGLPGGRVCEFTVHPAPLGNAAPGCVVVVRDVTRAREQDAVVAEVSRVFDVSFDASFVGVGLVSGKGEWLRVNPALQALLGHRDTQLIGTKVDDVTQVDDVGREGHLRELAIRNGETSYELDKRMIASGGDVFVAHVRMTGIIEDGEIRGWVAHVVAEDAWQRLDAPARPQRSRGPLRRRTG